MGTWHSRAHRRVRNSTVEQSESDADKREDAKRESERAHQLADGDVVLPEELVDKRQHILVLQQQLDQLLLNRVVVDVQLRASPSYIA